MNDYEYSLSESVKFFLEKFQKKKNLKKIFKNFILNKLIFKCD